MNNKCPTCGASYNITPQHVGRTFTCQRCQTPMVVQPEGLVATGAPQSAPPAPPPGGGAEAFAGMDAGPGAGFHQPPTDAGGFPQPPGGYSQPGPGAPNAVVDWLMFKKMSLPILLVVAFWAGEAYFIVEGFRLLVWSIQSMSATVTIGGVTVAAGYGPGVGGLFTSLLWLATFPLAWRLACEAVAAIMRTHGK